MLTQPSCSCIRSFAVALALSLLAPGAYSQPASVPRNPPDEAVRLSEFVVDASSTRGYAASNTLSGTRTNVPLIELPVSVQVITSELIEDMYALNDYEATKYNASWDERRVRGFRANFNLRNGFRRNDIQTPWTIDRMDIIMGPAAVLYGISQPGGIMNISTKPAILGQRTTQIRQTFGSFDYHQTVFDHNQPLGENLSLRFIGGYMNYYGTDGERAQGDLWVKHNDQRTVSGMLAGAWRLTPRTLLRFDVEVAERDESEARSAYQLLDSDVPIAVRYNIPIEEAFSGKDNVIYDDIKNVHAALSHRIGALEFQLAVDYFSRMNDRAHTNRVPAIDTDPVSRLRSVRLNWHSFSNYGKYTSALASAVYNWSWRDTSNKLFASYQHNDEISRSVAYEDMIQGTMTRRFYYIPLNNWQNANLDRPSSLNYVKVPRSTSDNKYYTASLSYQIKLWKERLIVSPGVTYVDIKNTFIPDGGAPQLTPQDGYNPQVGALYRVTPKLSIFALHATSVWPRAGSDVFNNPWKTETGESFEAGIKVNVRDGFAVGSISVYKIVQQNQVVFDPTAPNPTSLLTGNLADRGAQLQVGENTAEGVDFEVVLSPSERWQLILTYAYNDLYRTNDPVPANNGLRTGFWVRDSASFWTKYTFDGGAMPGFYIGGGARYNGKRFRQYRAGVGTYEDPLVSADAVAGWTHRFGQSTWTFTLNARNLLETHRESGFIPGTNNGYKFDIPREFYFSAGVRF